MKSNLENLSILSAVIFLASCGGGQKEASDANAEFESAKDQVAVDVKKVISDLPLPSEVPYLLIAAGAEFDENFVNPLDEMDAYQANSNRGALNLGIYATDVAYLSVYERSEKALEYMSQCQKLAAFVGVGDAIDYGMVARFENNMENKDSLIVVINEIMGKISSRLTEMGQVNSVATILAGIWIEGMYISTMIVHTYPTDDLDEESVNLVLEPLVQIVLQQKKSLNDLITSLNYMVVNVPESDAISAIITDLNKIKVIYDGELAEVEKQIAENTGDYRLSRDVLRNMNAEIKAIRNSIVE